MAPEPVTIEELPSPSFATCSLLESPSVSFCVFPLQRESKVIRFFASQSFLLFDSRLLHSFKFYYQYPGILEHAADMRTTTAFLALGVAVQQAAATVSTRHPIPKPQTYQYSYSVAARLWWPWWLWRPWWKLA